MKIGVDASCWVNRRGYGRYTRELLLALLALDDENEYRLFLDAETARQGSDLPVRARQVVVRTSEAAAQAASASGRRSLRDLWAMRRAVQEHGGDLDVFYFPSVYTFFPIRTSAKVVVTIHDTIAERFPELIFPNRRARMFWNLKVRHALRRADLVATVSQAAKRDLVQEFGLEEGRVAVISDAVSASFHPVEDRARTAEVVARLGIEGRRFILYVGGISPHKNLSTLLEAHRSLVREGGESVALVLAGDFEADVFYSSYPELQRQIQGSGASDVIFTGYVTDDDLLHLYNAAEVLVLPSFHEGFGLPALEAMACGTPVVASLTDALAEVTGNAGRLFDPSSPDDLVKCLHAVLTDDGLRQEMGRRGLTRARELSWEASARVALATFEALAS